MSTQLKQAPSDDPKALTKLYGDVVLREVKDQELVLKYVSVLIDRLSKLYQIQNWTADNSVLLAEWVIENYSCEMLKTIDKVLRHPPKSEESNWRLTPDTITRWMEQELENLAVERENWNHNMKGRTSANELIPIPDVERMYERMKMPARITELAKEDMREYMKKYQGVDMKKIEEEREKDLKNESETPN